ncbi:hypothetical protein LNQ52_13440 [Klebsiella pneumoniae subsp. pneumoniae]|nr:hypothetical protein [Klebsiella pneumoniae subsp. pneumoniae]
METKAIIAVIAAIFFILYSPFLCWYGSYYARQKLNDFLSGKRNFNAVHHPLQRGLLRKRNGIVGGKHAHITGGR